MTSPSPAPEPRRPIDAAPWRVRCVGGPLDGHTVDIGHAAVLHVPHPDGGTGRYERDPADPTTLRYLGPVPTDPSGRPPSG